MKDEPVIPAPAPPGYQPPPPKPINPIRIVVYDRGLQRYIVCRIRSTHELARYPVYDMTELRYEHERDAIHPDNFR